jgi:hypothetical protein
MLSFVSERFRTVPHIRSLGTEAVLGLRKRRVLAGSDSAYSRSAQVGRVPIPLPRHFRSEVTK